MSKQKIGVAIFAGLLVVTGIVSSGRFFDSNALLDQFMGRSSGNDEMASLSEGVEIVPDGGESAATAPAAVEPNETNEQAKQVEKPAEMPEAASAAVEQPLEDSTAPVTEKPVEEAATTSVEKSMKVPVNAEENQPAVGAKPETDIDATQGETEAAAIAAPQPVPPVFDLLRVEPNGDMVVAGVSSPGAEMELVAGTKTLTKTTANANGEFVAILDEALSAGDYEIVLRSTDANGLVMTSAETAIVSIPEAGSDEVIALVEAPGEPSRLITVPEAQTATAPSVSNETEEENAELAAAEAEPAQTPENTEEATIETASVEPEAETVTEQATPAENTEKRVRIEAVEIDGPTVFVAGAAEPGTKLRIYANEILLGDTQASAQGRFLIEVNKELPVGDYIIRADALTSNGAEVVMRAAVPFTRSAGEKLAAVAVPATTRLPNEPPKIERDAAGTQASTAFGNDAMPKEAEGNAVVARAPAAEQSGSQSSGGGELEQPLTPVENSVVIRRGDTLWHISKRVYGQGIKYTTIYKANDEQIRDPDMIWPGQVFALPDEAAANNN